MTTRLKHSNRVGRALLGGVGPDAAIDWATPPALFEALHAEFGFTLDVCASPWNAKLPRYFTEKEDGLAQDWSGERCFMNPPYGRAVGNCGSRRPSPRLAGSARWLWR